MPRSLLCLLALTLAAYSAAETCGYLAAQENGSVDAAVLPEMSGMALSQRVPGTLYAVNDSRGPELVVMALDGSSPRSVALEGVASRQLDLEALSVGPCGASAQSCAFVANSGGNNFARDTVEVYLVPEAALDAERADLLATLRLRYPDGPHDAEGFAVHPNGDLYLLTKETLSLAGVAPSKLYRVPAERWQRDPSAVHELQLVATLDLGRMSPVRLDLFSQLATDLAIAPGGDAALVLTYGDAFELDLDLSNLDPARPAELSELPYQRIPLSRLPQQESAGYLPDGRGFLYGSEAVGRPRVPLYRVTCRE